MLITLIKFVYANGLINTDKLFKSYNNNYPIIRIESKL